MIEMLGHIFAPLPIIGVTFGAALIAIAQYGYGACESAMSALRPLVMARPDEGRDAARATLYKVDEIAHLHGVARTDRVRATHPFIAEALTSFANAPDVERFALWVDQALADRRARHGRAIGFWNALADAAPAMGMAGTIIGLIGMFANMRDPGSIGPSMALALMATLHGMILANVVAGPIAIRLNDLSEREIAWQRAFADRMIAIARREGGPVRKSSIREVA